MTKKFCFEIKRSYEVLTRPKKFGNLRRNAWQ